VKVGKPDIVLLLIVGALPAHGVLSQEVLPNPVPVQDAAARDRFACHALKAMDLGEATGAGVRLADVGLLPASADQPQLCRVNGFVEPQVGFEVRMPVRGWNGKLLVTGCSNLCGSLEIRGMEDALARGYATATTDMGHRTADPSDATWAWNNPALEADFGHRATHVSTLAARQLVGNYYGNEPDHSYFRGCSTGGRQALVAAERYPEDFDGIIAGAPFNQLQSVPHMAWAMAANTGADGKPILRQAEMKLLGQAALDACDGQDGRVDGVIANPEACEFRPESLQCPGDGGAAKGVAQRDCLAPAAVEAARLIYAGPGASEAGAWSSAGAPVGSEFSWAASLLAPEGKTPFFQFIVQNWLHYLAFEPDPPEAMAGQAPLVLNFAAGKTQFAATNAVVGFNAELKRFGDLGGRLIVYHGWADQSLMPAHTIDYWREASRRVGGESALGEFARLFMVPGMQHCGGGPGATEIDFLTALERWVEADEEPASLLAHKVREPVSTQVRQPRFPIAPAAVEYTRPVYPYPQVAP
jgi:pimeloyl-ACP methyl ester carboxylesterase